MMQNSASILTGLKILKKIRVNLLTNWKNAHIKSTQSTFDKLNLSTRCLLFSAPASLTLKPLWKAINCPASHLGASLATPIRPNSSLAPSIHSPTADTQLRQPQPSNDRWLMLRRDKTQNKTQRVLSYKVWLQHGRDQQMFCKKWTNSVFRQWPLSVSPFCCVRNLKQLTVLL